MPKYLVTVARDRWEKTEIEVEAVNETAAEAVAIAKAEADERLEWDRQEIGQFDAIEVEEVEPAAP
jgi:hypothetical protein